MGKIVDSLFQNNMLNDTSWFLTSSLNKQVQMVRNNYDLKNWYTFAKENADFWDLRNRTMVGNIINFSNIKFVL